MSVISELTNLDPVAERAAWLAERRKGIGGSDAAAALGLSPYATPYDLWLDKTGQALPEPVESEQKLRWGQRHESSIAEEYGERMGVKVHRVNRILRHPQYPWMLANLDRRIVGMQKGLEIKTVDKDAARFGDWGDDGTDEIPANYVLQVQHYYAVTGYTAFDVAALVGGNDLRIYPIPRDEALIADLIKLEAAFWRCVETNTPPDIISIADARKRFPVAIEEPIEATPEIVVAYNDLVALRAQKKVWEESMERLSGEIAGFMGDHDTLMHGGKKIVTFKMNKGRAGYTVEAKGPSRTFLVKD